MDDMEIFTLWFIGGVLLMLLEFIIPGGVIFFLGLGATGVALLLYTGVIEGWLQAFTAWFIGSLALLFGLRGLVQKLIPAHIERGKTDEDLDAYDQQAQVLERIPAGGQGRIEFRGSTWSAKNYHDEQVLEPGTPVRIVFRDNLVWTVEALDGTDLNSGPEQQSEQQ